MQPNLTRRYRQQLSSSSFHVPVYTFMETLYVLLFLRSETSFRLFIVSGEVLKNFACSPFSFHYWQQISSSSSRRLWTDVTSKSTATAGWTRQYEGRVPQGLDEDYMSLEKRRGLHGMDKSLYSQLYLELIRWIAVLWRVLLQCNPQPANGICFLYRGQSLCPCRNRRGSSQMCKSCYRVAGVAGGGGRG